MYGSVSVHAFVCDADNLYILLRGQKRFTLFSPREADILPMHGAIQHVFPNGLIAYEAAGGRKTFSARVLLPSSIPHTSIFPYSHHQGHREDGAPRGDVIEARRFAVEQQIAERSEFLEQKLRDGTREEDDESIAQIRKELEELDEELDACLDGEILLCKIDRF